MKKLGVLFALITYINITAELPEIEIKKPNKWAILENKLIKIPNNKANSLKNRLLKLSSIIGAYVLMVPINTIIHYSIRSFFPESQSRFIIKLKIDNISHKVSLSSQTIGFFFCALTIASFVKAYLTTHNYLLGKLEIKNLTKFIKKWPKNKTHTPKECHIFFDKLYQISQENKIKANDLEIGLFLIKQSIDQKMIISN